MPSARLLPVLILWPALAPAGENWPEFRGPTADGHSDSAGVPLTWSETENVAWKTPIHGRGWSSPVVWGAQVWLTTATEDGRKLFAVCVDRATGEIVHDRQVFDVEEPELIPKMNTYASPTPVIEAGRVYVHFGTYGTACLDTETAETVWTRRDLNCEHHMGPGSSPTLFGDLLVFHVDGMDVQYVIALDKATGKTVWKTDRSIDYTFVMPFSRKAFCMPTFIGSGEGVRMISPGGKGVMAYDPRTGEELWKVRYFGWSIAPRPVFGHGLVFVVIDHDHPELWAIRLGGQGDVTQTHVAWKLRKGMPNVASLLLIDDLLFMVNEMGLASCVEADSGEIVWQQRMKGSWWASPVYVDGRIYYFNRHADATVVGPGRRFHRLAANELGDDEDLMMASPAVAGKAFFLRTSTHLYRIEKEIPR
jgi:outer membrane protein assembly factor BamB